MPDVASPALPEHGRGLRLVAALATRAGVVGDHRGRLVWADVRWADDAPDVAGSLDGYTAALRDIQTVLAARYPEVSIWFGRTTMQWWAMAPEPGPGWLLTAESPLELAQLLDVYRVTQRQARRRSRGRRGLTGRRPGPPAGRQAQPPRGSWRAVALAPRRIQQARVLISSPGRSSRSLTASWNASVCRSTSASLVTGDISAMLWNGVMSTPAVHRVQVEIPLQPGIGRLVSLGAVARRARLEPVFGPAAELGHVPAQAGLADDVLDAAAEPGRPAGSSADRRPAVSTVPSVARMAARDSALPASVPPTPPVSS